MQDISEIKAISLVNNILTIEYNGTELPLNIGILIPSIELVVNEIINDGEITTWKNIINLLLEGTYKNSSNCPIPIIPCSHDCKWGTVTFEDDNNSKGYYCNKCGHIFVSLVPAINLNLNVLNGKLYKVKDIDGLFILTANQIRIIDGELKMI